MSLRTWLLGRGPEPAAPPEERAGAEIARAYTDLVSQSRECFSDEEYAKSQAGEARRRAEDLEAKVGVEWSSLTVAYAAFGSLAMAAVFALDTWMFSSLGWPLAGALLFGCIVSSLYAGFGLMAKSFLSNGTATGRAQGAAVLLALGCVAAWLVPVLASARADELTAADLEAARTTVTSASLYASEDPAEAASVQFARQKVARLEQQRDTVRNVAAGALLGALMVEISFAGYALAAPLSWRSRGLRRLERRFLQDAADAATDAEDAVTETQATINDVGARYGLPLDDLTRIAAVRWEAHRDQVRELTQLRAHGLAKPSPRQPLPAPATPSGPAAAPVRGSSSPSRERVVGPASAASAAGPRRPRTAEPAAAPVPPSAAAPAGRPDSPIAAQAAWDGIWA